MKLDIYLVSYGRGREEGGTAEREREKQRGEKRRSRGKGETEAASLKERWIRRKDSGWRQAGRSACLSSRWGEWMSFPLFLH